MPESHGSGWIDAATDRILSEGIGALDDIVAEHPDRRAEIEILARTIAVARGGRTDPSFSLDEYEVLGDLGRGGMGRVLLARQRGLGRRPVAIKLLAEDVLGDDAARRRLEREIDALAQLDHPNLLPVHTSIMDREGMPVGFAMPLVRGCSLGVVIARARDSGSEESSRGPSMHGVRETIAHAAGRIDRQLGESDPDADPVELTAGVLSARSWSQFVCLVGEAVAMALSVAHGAGLLHRDVKPSNVLLDREGRVRLADFGLVASLSQVAPDSLTEMGQFVGTLAYAAPEQRVGGGRGTIGPATDFYGLGATTRHAATGVPPGGDSAARDAWRIPRDLRTVIEVATEPDPARRFASAAALAEDFGRIVRLEPVRVRRVPLRRRAWRSMRRHRGAVVGGGLGVGLTLVAMMAVLWMQVIAPAQGRAIEGRALESLFDENFGDLIQSGYFWLSFDRTGSASDSHTSTVADGSNAMSQKIKRAAAELQGGLRYGRGTSHRQDLHDVLVLASRMSARPRQLGRAAEELIEDVRADYPLTGDYAQALIDARRAKKWLVGADPERVEAAIRPDADPADLRFAVVLALLALDVDAAVLLHQHALAVPGGADGRIDLAMRGILGYLTGDPVTAAIGFELLRQRGFRSSFLDAIELELAIDSLVAAGLDGRRDAENNQKMRIRQLLAIPNGEGSPTLDRVRALAEQCVASPVAWPGSYYEEIDADHLNPLAILDKAMFLEVRGDLRAAFALLAQEPGSTHQSTSILIRALEAMLQRAGEPLVFDVSGEPDIQRHIADAVGLDPEPIEKAMNDLRALNQHLEEAGVERPHAQDLLHRIARRRAWLEQQPSRD